MDQLRQDYEDKVRALAARARALQSEGIDSETIARQLHAERRTLAAHYKALTPEPLRSRLTARTQAVYGTPDGPDIDVLRANGKSWDDIIAAAARPGRFPPDNP